MSDATRTVTVELPATLVERAEGLGLLCSSELGRLIEAEVKRQAWAKFDELRARIPADAVPLTDDEIVAEIKAARRERRLASRPR